MRITRKDQKELNFQVNMCLDEYSFAKPDIDGFRIKETEFGPIAIKLDDHLKSPVYSIYMQKRDVLKNLNELNKRYNTNGLNTWSGKWNIHDFDMSWPLKELENRLEALTYPI